MSQAAETLEAQLLRDLGGLGDRFVDDEFSSELYRALTNNRWQKESGPEGAVSLSWSRAEELVNELRSRAGREPLALAQTGGEGEVSDLVAGELGRLGWRARALNTSRRDEQHLTQPESPPPADHGQRHAPADDARDWEQRAHEEADESRSPRLPPGAASS